MLDRHGLQKLHVHRDAAARPGPAMASVVNSDDIPDPRPGDVFVSHS
jgi:hypothetical protein